MVQSLLEGNTHDSVYLVLVCFQDPRIRKPIGYATDDKCLDESQYVLFLHPSLRVGRAQLIMREI